MEAATIKIDWRKCMEALVYRIEFEDPKSFVIRQRIAAVLFRFAAWVAGVKHEVNIADQALKRARERGLI